MGAFFHPECFRCHACGYPITEHEVSPLISKDFLYIQIHSVLDIAFIKCCTIDFQMKFLSVFHFWIKFSLSGRDTYHKSCFKELTHPKCEVCHQFVSNSVYSRRDAFHIWLSTIKMNFLLLLICRFQLMELVWSSTDATRFGHKNIVPHTSTIIQLGVVVVNVWRYEFLV